MMTAFDWLPCHVEQTNKLLKTFALTSSHRVLSFNLFLKNNFIYLFIGLCWVFVTVCGLSPVAVSRGYSSLRCAGFSLQWFLLLQSMEPRVCGLQ